jgi:ribosomal protein S18 acetylase RimI-like enzyme
MSITIRQSTPADVFAIRKVQRITWMDTYPNKEAGILKRDIKSKFANDSTPQGKAEIARKKKRYQNPSSQIWVAETENNIIGFAAAIKEKTNNRIGAVYVLPQFQHQGIGHQLITKALAWLGKAKPIYVNSASYNQKALNFYRKYGFRKTGRQGYLDSAAKLPTGKQIPETELVKQF